MSDQVPELMYAQERAPAGTAATAEAVSCVAGTMTGTGPAPVSVASAGRIGPSSVPGCTSVPKSLPGNPNARTRSYAQVRALGSIIWLVLASVYSLHWMPVSQ